MVEERVNVMAGIGLAQAIESVDEYLMDPLEKARKSEAEMARENMAGVMALGVPIIGLPPGAGA